MKKTIKLFYLHGFFREFVLLYPVYLLMFESRGLSIFEISALLMVWSVPVFLLEIPSGALADMWSRKNMIVLGTALKLAGFAIWLLAHDFVLFAAGFILWGMQEAFCSGSTEALLFDVLKEHDMERDYEKYAGRFRFFSGIAMAMAMATGGFVAASGFHLAAILSIASIGLSMLFALMLKDVKNPILEENSWKLYLQQLKNGFALSKKSIRLTITLALCALIGVVPGVLEEYDQLYAQRVGLSFGMVGVWGASRTGMESLGCWFADRAKRIFGTAKGISILAAVAGLLLFVSVYVNEVYMLPVYGLFYMLTSCAYVLAEGRIQRLADSSQRATVLSINSLLINLSGFIILLGFGVICEYWSMRIGFLAMAVLLVLLIFALALADKVIRKTQKE